MKSGQVLYAVYSCFETDGLTTPGPSRCWRTTHVTIQVDSTHGMHLALQTFPAVDPFVGTLPCRISSRVNHSCVQACCGRAPPQDGVPHLTQ